MTQLASSLLSHYAIPSPSSCKDCPEVMSRLAAAARWFSIALRRVGKLVAAFNAVCVVATCLAQFSNLYNTCYCASSVLGRGSSAYLSAVFSDSQRSRMIAAWIAGSSLAAVTVIAFISFIFLYIDTPLPKDLVSISQSEDICLCRTKCH